MLKDIAFVAFVLAFTALGVWFGNTMMYEPFPIVGGIIGFVVGLAISLVYFLIDAICVFSFGLLGVFMGKR